MTILPAERWTMRLLLCLSLVLGVGCETPNDIGEVCSEIPRIVSETMRPSGR